MVENNKSYWQLGEDIKVNRKSITKFSDEIQKIQEKLHEASFTADKKYRMSLNDSLIALNEISEKHFQIRQLEEDINKCEWLRTIKSNSNLYELQLSINTYEGQIEFSLLTKGEFSEKLFIYDGKKLKKINPDFNMNESSWVKYGDKKIRKSVLKIFDKKYILHVNGDFVVLSIIRNEDVYGPEDIIGNVLNFDKML